MSERKPKLLKLVEYKDPILRKQTLPVEFPLSAQDKAIIEDMKYSIHPEQLKKAKAPWEQAVGMAANQWGIDRQIFLYCPTADSDEQLEVMINPQYEPLPDLETSLQELGWEGCFSVPLALGKIQRHTRIKATYQNEEGETIVKELEDYPARVFQHESDHLNGFLYDDEHMAKCAHKESFASVNEALEFREEKK